MKQHQLICGALLVAVCSFLPAVAQIEKPSESELDAAPSQFQDLLHGKSKLISQTGPNAPKTGGPGGGPPGMAQPTPIKNPSTDPHDLTGYWARGGGFGGPGGPAKPGGAPARGGNPFGSGPPAQPGIVGHTKIDASRLCAIAPGPMTTSGRIYQDATKLTIVGSIADIGDSLRARRIYFATQHDPNATASYNGDSIAHWDGDTLVVDTIKLKGLITSFGGDLENGTHNVLTVAPDLHVVERITKSADGSSLTDDQTWYAPAESKTPYHTSSTAAYSADPLGYDAECEDVGDMFGPNYGGGV